MKKQKGSTKFYEVAQMCSKTGDVNVSYFGRNFKEALVIYNNAKDKELAEVKQRIFQKDHKYESSVELRSYDLTNELLENYDPEEFNTLEEYVQENCYDYGYDVIYSKNFESR